MPELSDINTVKAILNRHGFHFSKSLGQNFIVNPELCPRIAEESGVKKGVCALEVGPGIGVLTKELALRAEKVLSIEIDESLLPVLKETLGEFENVEILNEDVMKLDLKKVVKERFGDMPFVVCANLPYYITSPVLMKLLEENIGAQSITVMVQKEAAERLCAEVGTREAGAVSVAVSYYSKPEILFTVNKESFMPPPKVDSAVIRLKILEKPPVKVNDERAFFRLVKCCFAQRRKTAQNGISAGLGLPKEQVAEALENIGLQKDIRAENMTMQELAALADSLCV